ncbi:MAG: aspartate dehydrogenase [Methanomicrobiaceae archaeon]|nr:aspartate dehydrogenase [Methanomicrobiaceae archaeon]
MIRIGLLGCGNVGHVLAKYPADIRITAVYDIIRARAEEIAAATGAKVCTQFEDFITGDFDLVVEAASVQAVAAYAEEILRRGKDLVILSVGALSDHAFYAHLEEAARAAGRRIYIPSGAIIGLDNLKIGQITDITRLTLKTTKNPASLGIRADTKMLVFRGTAHDCIREFPKNINVAVALELAAGREAEVELWVDPAVDRNIHEIFAEGAFGEIEIRVRNTPSPENPATSYLAALSIITLLRNLERPISVGT